MDVLAAYAEIEKARHHALKKHPAPHNSRHESYAVILEELDELWDEIKADGTDARVVAEAAQVGAMVIRLLTEVIQEEK